MDAIMEPPWPPNVTGKDKCTALPGLEPGILEIPVYPGATVTRFLLLDAQWKGASLTKR